VMREHIAVEEARNLGIPVFAMVDTNSNPHLVDYVIPSNDDATKSIAVIMETVSASIKESLSQRKTEKDKPGSEKLTKAAAKVAAE